MKKSKPGFSQDLKDYQDYQGNPVNLNKIPVKNVL